MKVGAEQETVRVARPLVKVLAYGLYFVVVTAFFIWFRLPATVLKEATERALHEKAPQLVWRVAQVALQFPLAIALEEVAVSKPGGQDSPWFVLERLTITPAILPLLRGGLALDFQAKFWQGTLSGAVNLPERSATLVDMKAEFADLVLPAGTHPLTVLGRELHGKASGRLRYRGRLDAVQGEGEASLRLSAGGVSLTEPLFGLTKVEVDQSQFDLVLQGAALAVKKGSFRNKDFVGELAGVLTLNSLLSASEMQLEGWAELFPSFFVNLHLTGGAQDFVKKRSRDGKIPFALQGLLTAPRFTLK